ncbi:MAG: dual specificity protein phosphatase family protein [Anaerolineae bacterium]|nr:dual specificity protein phosphatase family protein [Anaerolineae bacterium]
MNEIEPTLKARPNSQFYVVLPGKLLAGSYPYPWDPEKLRALLEAGVTFFVDLTETGELESYAFLLAAEANRSGLVAEHHRLPIPDFDTPTPAEMKNILDTMDAALQAGHTVYVHCHYGLGRTGTVIGCYLARHGQSGAQALAELAALRQGTSLAGMSSPITPVQRQMVGEWPAGG